MIIDNKLVNESYLKDEVYRIYIPNLRNKKYIDDWVNRNYIKLYNKFARNDDTITQKGYGKRDVFHESLIRIYMNKERFKNQDECDNYMNKFFQLCQKTNTTESSYIIEDGVK